MRGHAKYVVCNESIVYENGATVCTSFVTNMGDKKVVASSDLNGIIKKINKENLRKQRKELPGYVYPDEVITSTMLSRIAARGVSLEIEENDLCFIRALDAQKESGKGLFGSGFLLSPKAAAEKAARYVWELSERELSIARNLGK